MSSILYIGIGGFLGAISRYGSGVAISRLTKGFMFPMGTFFVNMLGTFIMGFMATWVAAKLAPNTAIRPFFLVGFLGSFTTFSSFMLEAAHLFVGQNSKISLLYIVGQVSLGCIFMFLGIWLAQRHMI